MRLNSLLLPLGFDASLAWASDCSIEAINSILPANATTLSAVQVSANGTYGQGAADIAYPTNPTNLPGLCAVIVNVTSSPTSSFTFGLFLPEQWNERFLTVGNGGFAGGINWLDMGAGVGYGFAVVSSDLGHNSTSGDITWALNEPEKKIDFGYRALHGSTVLAKQIVEAFYGCQIKYSYYSGCSTGGRQGLKEAELYPEEFDGILAGAPAWWTSHLQTWTVKLGEYNLPVDAPNHIPVSLFSVIAAEVIKQCDGSDGLVDGIVSDPARCNFFPEALLCTPSSNKSACLTSPQISTLYNIYNDYVETNQTFVFPHLEVGSEAQWPVLLGGNAPHPLGTQYVQYFLLNDPNWQWQDFNYSIVQLADSLDPGNATFKDFSLSGYRQRGGKLLHYHGLADALISTGSSVYLHNHILRAVLPTGGELDSWYRFFLVPGMQHCSGTAVNAPWYFAGANQAGALGTGVHSTPGFEDGKHDALLALMAWVEHGTAPNELIATRWNGDDPKQGVLRQRPLCNYPLQAKYKGSGNVNEAVNWECASLY